MQTQETITKTIKIKNINKIGQGNVVNLTVKNNHTFITKNGIPTHNCDSISPLGQRILRNTTEAYSSTCRFILTCNYENRIIPALHSRFEGGSLHLDSLDYADFSVRVGEILVNEGVEFDMDVLDSFIEKTFPDLRKCINLVEKFSMDGVLIKPKEEISSDKDYITDLIPLFKAGKATEARKLLVSQTSIEEYEGIFRWLYESLDLFTDNDNIQNNLILIISKGLRGHTLSADPEINISATIIEMCNALTE